ncbi:RCC1 domain-containing protein 1 [Dimargaris xerosporica]|nr:RCC1 domain-containing protein 1 [Dimargaris xerosporica]
MASVYGVGYNGFAQIAPVQTLDHDGQQTAVDDMAKMPSMLEQWTAVPQVTAILAADWNLTWGRLGDSTTAVYHWGWCPNRQQVVAGPAQGCCWPTDLEPVVSVSPSGRLVRSASQFLFQIDLGASVVLQLANIVSMAHTVTGHAAAITQSGVLWQWEMDSPTTTLHLHLIDPPSFPTHPAKLLQVVAGWDHFLARDSAGNVYSWGQGRFGQTGHGHLTDTKEPTLVAAIQGIFVASIATGAWHSMLLSDIGDVYAFGRNDHGQLGLNVPPDESTLVPQLVQYESDQKPDIATIACGEAHSVVTASTFGYASSFALVRPWMLS